MNVIAVQVISVFAAASALPPTLRLRPGVSCPRIPFERQSRHHNWHTPTGDAIVSGGVPSQTVYLSESSSSLSTGRK